MKTIEEGKSWMNIELLDRREKKWREVMKIEKVDVDFLYYCKWYYARHTT